jgi:hypothetical protein
MLLTVWKQKKFSALVCRLRFTSTAHVLLCSESEHTHQNSRRLQVFMFKNKLFKFGTGLVFSVSLAGTALAQTPSPSPSPTDMPVTTTKTTTTTMKSEVVQNADGTYSVIEYPVNKEVVVDLTPMTSMSGAKGLARVMRMNNETTVNFDLSGVGDSATSYHAYAVDATGAVTYLGPITAEKGMGKASFKTPLKPIYARAFAERRFDDIRQ